MGSRALSHDSIFLTDQVLTDAEPVKVLSQENVHSKIKALQMKLQQQKMHLGPPPLVLPIRRPEELGSYLEDDSLPHRPPEISGCDATAQGALSKSLSHPASHPLSPILKPAVTKPLSLTPSIPVPLSISSFSVVEPPLDFSSPAQFTPCLDTSAARHRMSVKPRNQRASTKKRLATTDSSSYSHNLNNIDHPESVKEEEQQISAQYEDTLRKVEISVTSQLPSKCLEVAPITPEAAPKSPSITSQHYSISPVTVPSVSSPVLRVKPHRTMERPHSSFIGSELKDKREQEFETQLVSHDKRNAPIRTGIIEDSSGRTSATLGSVVAFRSSSDHQQVQGELENTGERKRAAPGSGSFHLCITTGKTRDGERPRSGSFVGALEMAKARNTIMGRTEDKPFSGMKEKEEMRDLQTRGGGLTVGRLRQEGASPKSSVPPQERDDILQNLESVTTSKNIARDTSPAAVGEVESRQEVVEEAVEGQGTQEEEGKTAFGVKLRPTSQSTRFRSDASAHHHLKSSVTEEQGDEQKRQEISENVICASKKLPTNISSTPSTTGDNRQTDKFPSSFSVQVNLPSASDPYCPPTESEKTISNPKQLETAAITAPPEPQPAPQTTSSDVSWMTLALEKTRSLQQLFTSRFPRDFTPMQTTVRPQAQVQTTIQTETQATAQMQSQNVKIQPSTTLVQTANKPLLVIVKPETLSAKPPQMVVQQKTPTMSTGPSPREPQMSKPIDEPQSAPQSASDPSVQTNTWTTQSPLRSSTQTETSSSATQSLAQTSISLCQHDTAQQPPWTGRNLNRTNQVKSTTMFSNASTSPDPSPAEKQEKGSSLSERRTVWAGSVSERAAFLEKQTEWTNPLGNKGVELKKNQTEVLTPGETPASTKTTVPIKHTKLEGRVKPAESSPVKVQDRPREDKWTRKNMSSPSPSSSPTPQSVLQSMSESGQPSWMELAKRKSMAWSDKTMD
ncbi:mucin-2 isoform X2 [Channa argus]